MLRKGTRLFPGSFELSAHRQGAPPNTANGKRPENLDSIIVKPEKSRSHFDQTVVSSYQIVVMYLKTNQIEHMIWVSTRITRVPNNPQADSFQYFAQQAPLVFFLSHIMSMTIESFISLGVAASLRLQRIFRSGLPGRRKPSPPPAHDGRREGAVLPLSGAGQYKLPRF